MQAGSPSATWRAGNLRIYPGSVAESGNVPIFTSVGVSALSPAWDVELPAGLGEQINPSKQNLFGPNRCFTNVPDSLDSILALLKEFILPIFGAVRDGKRFGGKWNTNGRWF